MPRPAMIPATKIKITKGSQLRAISFRLALSASNGPTSKNQTILRAQAKSTVMDKAPIRIARIPKPKSVVSTESKRSGILVKNGYSSISPENQSSIPALYQKINPGTIAAKPINAVRKYVEINGPILLNPLKNSPNSALRSWVTA